MDANLIAVVELFVRWIHLFSAILFIGGSFFMWIVLVPASKEAITDEAVRTLVVAKISKRFARLTPWLLSALIITGILNSIWYIPSTPYQDYPIAAMASSAFLLVVLLYGPGKHYGKMIAKLAREGKVNELTAVRRKSTAISLINLALMVLISVIAVLL